MAVQILFIDRSNFIRVRLFTGDASIDSDQNKFETAALTKTDKRAEMDAQKVFVQLNKELINYGNKLNI